MATAWVITFEEPVGTMLCAGMREATLQIRHAKKFQTSTDAQQLLRRQFMDIKRLGRHPQISMVWLDEPVRLSDSDGAFPV